MQESILVSIISSEKLHHCRSNVGQCRKDKVSRLPERTGMTGSLAPIAYRKRVPWKGTVVVPAGAAAAAAAVSRSLAVPATELSGSKFCPYCVPFGCSSAKGRISRLHRDGLRPGLARDRTGREMRNIFHQHETGSRSGRASTSRLRPAAL